MRRTTMVVRQISILIVLAGAVVWGGAIRPPATVVFAVASVLTLLLAAVSAVRLGEPLRLGPLALVPLVMAGLCCLQLLPLPHGLRLALSPESTRVQDLALAPDAPGWRPLTADVAATLHQAVKLAGIGAFALGLGPLASRSWRSWLRPLALAPAVVLLGVAALGLLGVIERPLVGTTKAALALPMKNPNHAAALLVSTLPLALALAVRSQGQRRILLAALVALGNAALFATSSRAGIGLGMAAQAFVLASLLSARPILRMLAVAGMAATGAFFLLSAVHDSGERLALVGDGLRIARENPWTGIGRGAFELVENRFAASAGQHRFGFVENEYVQTVADFGIPGTLVMLLTLVLAGRWMLAAWPEHERERAAAIGLLALALHNMVDFSWEAAAVAATACVLGAFAFPNAGRAIRTRALAGVVGATLALSALTLTPLGRTFEADAEALRLAALGPNFQAQAEAAFRRHPADGYVAVLAANRMLSDGDPSAALWIRRALLVGPNDPFAHQLAGRALLRTGHLAQAALEFRLATVHATDRDRPAMCQEAMRSFETGFELLATEMANEQASFLCLLESLRGLRKWKQVEQLALPALGGWPTDRTALRALVEARLELGETDGLSSGASRLVAADSSAEAALLASRAWRRAGEPATAQPMLEAAWLRFPHESELPLELARVALDQGNVDRARSVLADALARAVDQNAKATLHQGMAEAEDRAGNAARASAERAEASRLRQ